ncbi:MAG: hypothetical protein CMJ48_10305 [Planctomycetaceae bacterium]|nr:hypothetical protein [Planctomycetaceae bacterium]
MCLIGRNIPAKIRQSREWRDLFFHVSALQDVTFEELQEGQAVEYVETQGSKGPRAESVRVV